MLTLAIVLFAVAAVGGATMAIIHFRGNNPPLPLAALHGVLAATALVILLLAVLQGVPGASMPSLILFVIAALGGFFLLSVHLRKQRLPSPVVLIHGGVAVLAFLILLFSVL
jgi:hypothetical protein